MKQYKALAHLISRHGLCSVLLATTLSSAVAASPAASEPAPSASSAQSQPRGSGRIELPHITANSPLPTPPTMPSAGNSGIPGTALDAYKVAAESVKAALPNCHLPWELIAGIGRVESVHASGYGLRTGGSTERPIRGPRLDGKKFALIKDTDAGRWDGDTEFDRAVGPTQFIPSTWASWGADGNADGSRDPNNIYDAALGTGLYLCAGGRDLSQTNDRESAVLSYNHSREYVNTVLGWMQTYQQGHVSAVPDSRTAEVPAADTSPAQRSTVASVPRKSAQTDVARRAGKPEPAATPKPASTPTTPPPPQPVPTRPTPQKPMPSPLARLSHLDSTQLQADQGGVFLASPVFRATTASGTPIAGARVHFDIVGDTEARFTNGKRRASALTSANGIAVVPKMNAGSAAGTFKVRTTVIENPQLQGEIDASVRPAADTLRMHTTTALTAVVGGFFPQGSAIEATFLGRPAAGITLTMSIGAYRGDAAESQREPFFEDEGGRPAATLNLPATSADGFVQMPLLHAGTQPGLYKLTVAASNGTSLVTMLDVSPVSP
ncbi:lytic transglycosylase domain-containing protein [Streptomyces sp. NPDC088745]|uniref:lytic transglycosylase domain-containing protein n=1 Tax=Streptomyces sp. NPDC088745 TaxID=3365884 RepID=UPI003810C004